MHRRFQSLGALGSASHRVAKLGGFAHRIATMQDISRTISTGLLLHLRVQRQLSCCFVCHTATNSAGHAAVESQNCSLALSLADLSLRMLPAGAELSCDLQELRRWA